MACCREFELSSIDVAREASMLNIQESKQFTKEEQELVTRYGKSLGTAMIFMLTNHLPKEFTPVSNA